MEGPGKSRSRREGIRKNRPGATWLDWDRLRGSGALASAGIAAAFFLCAWSILTLREEVVAFRPGQWIPHDVVSRVDFAHRDKDVLAHMRRQKRDAEPRVYKSNPAAEGDAWEQLRRELLALPNRLVDPNSLVDGKLAEKLEAALDGGAVTALRQYASGTSTRALYEQKVNDFVHAVRTRPARLGGQQWELIVLPARERAEDTAAGRRVAVEGYGVFPADSTVAADSVEFRAILNLRRPSPRRPSAAPAPAGRRTAS
jgi:hypothetical protein